MPRQAYDHKTTSYGEPLTGCLAIYDLPAGGADNLISDSVDLTTVVYQIRCDGNCTLKVTMASGDIVTLPFFRGDNWAAVKRIWNTGSSYSGVNIYGFY